ncbi:MAG TPA: thioredoxin domain-containing protein [Terriglobales bacterium]|nr:thioredoxin domain-containing protein [Terriglobales bacterium]
MFRSSVALALLVCVGCSAQSATNETNRRLERQVRVYFKVPATVNVAVKERKPSDFPGFEKVTVTLSDDTRSSSYDFLLSQDEKTLYRLTTVDISKDPFAENVKKIDTTGRPVRGNKDAKVEIVVYDDFQCPYCARMHGYLFQDIIKTHGDRIRVLYKDYPLQSIHPWATHAAINANCLAAQNHDAYWDFADRIHLNQKEVTGENRPLPEQLAVLDRIAMEYGGKHKLDASRLEACIKKADDSAVRASIAEGDALGVDSTPQLFINGELVAGAVPPKDLRAVLDRILVENGQQPPAAAAQNAGAPSSAPAQSVPNN